MSNLTTPSVASIVTIIRAQLATSIGVVSLPLMDRAFNTVVSKVLGGAVILLYKYAGFIFLQIFVKTATMREVEVAGLRVRPLVEWGRLIGSGDPVAATQARFNIEIFQTPGAAKITLTAGTQLLHAGNGITYLTLTSVVVNAPSVFVEVGASGDQSGGNGEGALGNLAVTDVLSFANPLAAVLQDAVVNAITFTASDEESEDDYRQRVEDRFKKRAQGGALVDYELWVIGESPGIKNVYPYTGDAAGEVKVYAEATVESSGSPDGIPTASQLLDVQAKIQLDSSGRASRRPVGAAVIVVSITRAAFQVEIVGLVVDAGVLASTQASITTAITEYMLDREPFVSGLTLPPKRDTITVHEMTGIVSDIVLSVQGTFTEVTFEKGAGDLESYTMAQGEKAKLDTLDFT